MNKNLITPVVIAVILSAVSCKSESEQQKERLQNDLKTYFTANVEDSTATLDSFQLIKVDTISQRMLLLEQSSLLNQQLDYIMSIFKINTQKLSIMTDQMSLYKMLGSQDLVDIQKNDFDKQSEKLRIINQEVDTVISIIEVISNEASLADTVKPVGYQAKCLYQLRMKDRSVKRDTAYIFLNNNYDILNREDFFKLPYKIDFDKFDD